MTWNDGRSKVPACSWFLTLGLLFSVLGCAHKNPRRLAPETKADVLDVETPRPLRSDDSVTASLFPEGSNENPMLAEQSDGELLSQLEKEIQDLPVVEDQGKSGVINPKSLHNPAVLNWVRYFSKREASRFQRHMDRAEPYRKVVQEILVKNGIPADIFYLGIVESGFITGARSTANAVGVWQFIKPTGERYGLEVNAWVDERRDVIRATEAAAKYLKDLHNVFNSWELALAAYNTGEGRVLRAILRGKSRDFWALLNKGVLPQETEDYVPKFVAAAYIYDNAEKFGFSLPEDEDHPRLAVVELPARVHLSDVARVSGMDAEKLAFYNPHLLKGVTPPGGRSYKIWVPRQHQKTVIASIANLPRGASSLVAAQSLGYSPQLSPGRSGKAFNPFAPNPASKSGIKSVAVSIPARAEAKMIDTRPLRNAASSSRKPAAIKTKMVYVKRGENLESLARRYQTNVEQLKELNRLKSGRVLAGQELKVPLGKGFSPVNAIAIVKYRVRKGDSLSSIADQFGVSMEKIRKDNKLRRQTVFAGEVIRVDKRGI